MKAARKAFEAFPAGAQVKVVRALTIAAEGRKADVAKPVKGVGPGVCEIALRFRTDAYRVVYAVQLGQEIWVIHAFQRIEDRDQDAKGRSRPDPRTDQTLEGEAAVSEDLEMVQGSHDVSGDHSGASWSDAQARLALATALAHFPLRLC